MKRIKENPFVLTTFLLFSFLYFVTLANAEMNGNCTEIAKDLKAPLSKAMKVHNGMHKSLKSDQPIDKYNRHINILVSNLGRVVARMERLLGKAEDGGCDQLVKNIRGRILGTKNIYDEMMASMQLPSPKDFLALQNDKLKSELDNLMEVH